MRVQGGKARIAKHLALEMLLRKGTTTRYLEPFLGGCSVLPLMAPHFRASHGSDVNPDLPALWHAALYEGWEPPKELTRHQWEALRSAPPSPLRTFAGFGCSYGGRWFQGYASSRGDDYAGAAGRGLTRRVELMRATVRERRVILFGQADYSQHTPGPGNLIYCDPPYSGRKPYPGQPPFDGEKFWAVMNQWVRSGALVFVSEYAAPVGWVPIWEKKLNGSMSSVTNTYPVLERLWMHETQVKP